MKVESLVDVSLSHYAYKTGQRSGINLLPEQV